MGQSRRWFAIKADVRDPQAASFVFNAQKTMYGGKSVAVGDTIFVFASENEGGMGLIARGIVTVCGSVPRTAAARQTPRVSITVERDRLVRRSLGRSELRPFRGQSDYAPEVELDFKLYRQATNKIVGLSDTTGGFLNGLF